MNSILSALVNGMLVSALLAFAVWTLLKLTPRNWLNAATRYAIWCTVLVVIVALPLLYLHRGDASRPGIQRNSAPDMGTTPLSADQSPRASRSGDRESSAGTTMNAPEGVPHSRSFFSLTFPIGISAGRWPAIVVFLWLVTSVLMMFRLIVSAVLLERSKSRAMDAPLPLAARIASWIAGSGAGRRIRLASSREISVPLVSGPRHPTILLPARLLNELSQSDLEQICIHEASHFLRRDDYALLIQRVAEALFSLHPVVRWVSSRIDLEREFACDDFVIAATGNSRSYAACLARVVELSGGVGVLPIAAAAIASGSHLARRVEMLLDNKRHAGTRLLGLRLATILVFISALAWSAARAPDALAFVHQAASVPMPALAPDQVQPPAQPAIATSAAPFTTGEGLSAAYKPESTAPAPNIVGTWQGTLPVVGKGLRVVIRILNDAGGLRGVIYSIDQGAQGIPARVTLQDSSVRISAPGVGGEFKGVLHTNGTISIAGTWTQGPAPLPLNLTLATGTTAWTIPDPPPSPTPMTDASPAFEVATIKPNNPAVQGQGFRVNRRNFSALDTSLADLIAFAYKIHPRQIEDGPAWLGSEKYDLDATPGGTGQPDDEQWRAMMRKLLADRFQLEFHRNTQDLPAFAIVAAKTSPKLLKSGGDPNSLPILLFRTPGTLIASNATMASFAQVMQAAALDRPVVDRTGLTGKYDFTLKWTPDETQFGGAAHNVTPPDRSPADPDLSTAMRQQLGLRLQSENVPLDVLVIDRVERPSEK